MAQYISKEKLEELKKEVELLETTERRKIAQKIGQAARQGDISDSADFTEAKEAQAFLEGKIERLKKIIAEAVLINNTQKPNKISVGSAVVVETFGKKERFEIVGSADANPLKGKISANSPLGSALIGKKVGDNVSVETPKGKVEYKVIEIN